LIKFQTANYMLWQNDSTRATAAWYEGGPKGNLFQSFGWIDSSGVPGWTVRAVTDLNGDGTPDLIWENDTTQQLAAWYLNPLGNVFSSFAWIDMNGVPGWNVVAAADLNQDGKSDLIFQNTSTRQVAVWFMGGPNGNQFQSFAWIDTNGIPGWTVRAAADLNGDGKPDIIWEKDSTSQIAAWYLGGAQGNEFQSFEWIEPNGIPGWTVAGAADLNGDGKPDIVLLNDSTRQAAVWYMGGPKGNVFQMFGWIEPNGVPGWHLRVPH
jgi:hypothetical protein